MGIFQKIIKLFSKDKPCDHQRNWTGIRYLQDNTPFVHFLCHDCGYSDRGHVYGDTEGWVGATECVDGVRREVRDDEV